MRDDKMFDLLGILYIPMRNTWAQRLSFAFLECIDSQGMFLQVEVDIALRKSTSYKCKAQMGDDTSGTKDSPSWIGKIVSQVLNTIMSTSL